MPKGRPKGFDEHVVLERAMETFWREGYAGASMAILLKDMGISRQSLYDTYGDKRALYLKALNLYIDREVGGIFALLKGPPPIKDRLLAVIEHFRAMAQPGEQRGCFIANALIGLKEDDHELRKILVSAIESLREALQRSIQSALDLGEITRKESASVMAHGLLNSLIGLATTSKASNSPEEIEDTITSIKGCSGLT